MCLTTRSHSQNNEIYQSMRQTLKKSKLRNRSLHKPTLVTKECSGCIKKYFQKKILYCNMKKNYSKYNREKNDIQELSLTNLFEKTLVLEKWSNKMLSLSCTMFESNLMY